jgi:16S rRNA (uracil1498-N3)-methyltransferase
MSIHTIYFPDMNARPGDRLIVGGEESHHAARVKRVESGDALRLCDARGTRAEARVQRVFKQGGDWSIEVRVDDVRTQPRPSPSLRVLAAAPKGDRLEAMLDGLAQVGVSAWSPLVSERTVVEPRAGKLDRLRRVAIEAMKQSGSVWAIEVGEPVSFAEALRAPAPSLVLADASGTSPGPIDRDATLLVGPEGGFTPSEVDAAQAAGATIARVARHTLRTEVAAVVAAGLLLAPRAG